MFSEFFWKEGGRNAIQKMQVFPFLGKSEGV
jgi:hypothetical protein